MSVYAEVTATIRMIGQEMNQGEIPAHLLVRTLDSLQKIIYLIASSQQKQNIGKRFRISDELRQFYTIRCKIPQTGSYLIPLVIKPPTNSQTSLFVDYPSLSKNLNKLLMGISTANLSLINEILPDSNLRNKALRESKNLLPKVGENWQLGIATANNSEIIITEKSNSHIGEWLGIDSPEDEIMTVTGELISINFDKHTIVIRYRPTHQEIECIYLEELEDDLIENRRQLVQVTGKFTLNADGHPIKLTDVTRIEPVDLSSILLEEISDDTTKLRFKQPYRLIPYMDEESSQLFVIEDETINLHVFADNRDDLIYEINEQIVMMWNAYTKRDVDKLATDARNLREILLDRLEEIS